MESKLSKIIIALIVIVIVAGALSAWYILNLKSTPSTAVETPNNDEIPGQANTVTVNPSQQNSSVTIDKKYVELFAKLSADPLTFRTINEKSTGGLGVIYALYANAVADSKKFNPKEADFSVQLSLTDLDKDGTPEAIVYNTMLAFCGSGGCSIDIYKVKEGKWVSIFSVVGGGNIGLSREATNGYSDLLLSVDSDAEGGVATYQWDGKTYQLKEVVATWDGTQFNLSK